MSEEPMRTFNLRLPEDLAQALDEAARQNYRSRSGEIIVRLERDLRNYPVEEGR